MRTSHVSWMLLLISMAAGCGGARASRARTRYAVQHGVLPHPSEIRVDEFLADYSEPLADPAPNAAGVQLQGARAAWASSSEEPLFVVQSAVRGRDVTARRPVALMFVVDRSGSMAEADKMTYVRRALHRLVEGLDPSDAVGIVAFDGRAELLCPLSRVAEADALHGAIDRLAPRGSTNLSEGLELGYAGLAQPGLDGYLRRVVLLTDAVANTGETDLRRISDWAARGDEAGIRLSAVGVGLAHRDDVLVEMARRGRGNHYFLDSPAEIERVFAREVQGTLVDVAERVRLTLSPMPGVEVVRVEGAEARREGDTFTVDLGRLGAGQHRVVLWTLRGVPPADRSPTVGRFTLDYVDSQRGEPARWSEVAAVPAATDAAQGTVARNSAVAWMATDLRRVSELAHAGRYAEAQARLDRVRAVIDAIARARPADEELARDLEMLEGFARALSRHSGRPVRQVRARIRVRVEQG